MKQSAKSRGTAGSPGKLRTAESGSGSPSQAKQQGKSGGKWLEYVALATVPSSSFWVIRCSSRYCRRWSARFAFRRFKPASLSPYSPLPPVSLSPSPVIYPIVTPAKRSFSRRLPSTA